jgi:hypothetical protein
LSPADLKLYTETVCTGLCSAVACMPAVHEALAIARPELAAQARYLEVFKAIRGLFGLSPDETGSSEHGYLAVN